MTQLRSQNSFTALERLFEDLNFTHYNTYNGVENRFYSFLNVCIYCTWFAIANQVQYLSTITYIHIFMYVCDM